MPFPSPGDLPDPGIEPGSPTLQADALPWESSGKPITAHSRYLNVCSFDFIMRNISLTMTVAEGTETLPVASDDVVIKMYAFGAAPPHRTVTVGFVSHGAK